VQNHRQLIDAEFGINEGAGGLTLNGKRLLNGVQASEKVFQSFVLEVKSNGGHSSLPTKDNAIYHLAEGLLRLSKYDFPVNLNEVTRAYFERSAKLESGQMAADLAAVAKPNPDSAAVARLSAIPSYNATIRTTCVTTRLEGGHADNALPQTARALVNCRILPTETAAQTQQTLVKIVDDSRINVTPKGTAQPSPPSPLNPAVMQPIEQITKEMWAGVPVVPLMSTGATDSAPLRNAGIPMYGVSGIFHDMNDVRMHGKDERIGVKEYYEGQEFLYRLVKALSSGK
jgi:acetylornithine deacetylase/succinyl-diaminopimelate desuccinylase-like protein